MRFLAITLLVLFVAIAQAHANDYGLYDDNGRSIYSLGPSDTPSYGTGSPSPDFFEYNNNSNYRGNHDWGEQHEQWERSQHRQEERMFWQQQSAPKYNKPIAPCGPYYAPRAAKGCY